MNAVLVGISGVAGSGKDTVADILVRDHRFVKVALADPLKRLARDVFDFTAEQLWGPSEMRNAPDERYPRRHTWGSIGDGHATCLCCGMRSAAVGTASDVCFLTPRYALQQLGTEWGRNCYPNVWIDYALRVAKKLAEGDYSYSANFGLTRLLYMAAGRSVVVPDLRFKNEVDAFRRAGAKLVRIVRSGAGIDGRHVSETEQESILDSAFDAVIVNNGTLEELEQKVRAFVAETKED
jgi:hypothetical protein